MLDRQPVIRYETAKGSECQKKQASHIRKRPICVEARFIKVPSLEGFGNLHAAG